MAENNEGEKKNSRVDLWAKGVTLVRETVLILLLLLLLIWPSSINTILQNAGFTEGNIAGFTWKKTLEESNEQTGNALQTVDQLKDQLAALETKLAAVGATSTEPAVKRSVDSAMAGVHALQDSASVVDRSLQTSYIKSKVILESIKHSREIESLAPATPKLREGIQRKAPSGDQ